jgi:hypothetical protein
LSALLRLRTPLMRFRPTRLAGSRYTTVGSGFGAGSSGGGSGAFARWGALSIGGCW